MARMKLLHSSNVGAVRRGPLSIVAGAPGDLTGGSVYGNVPYTESLMPTSTSRLDLRLNADDKARISRAAELRGMPVSAFVRDAVLREAESVMAAELTVTLSAEESRRFVKAFDAPFRPNARLSKALARAERG